MNSTIKTLVPNKEWLITSENKKIASICKSKKGYEVLYKGKYIPIPNWSELKSQMGVNSFDESMRQPKNNAVEKSQYSIYDFQCSSKPYSPVYSVKRKLPLYTKNDKSKSQYCAGFYLILFKKGWVKILCPKLITLERHQYRGPFKTEVDTNNALFEMLKYEDTTQHATN